jgi:hypothetical protein
MSSYPNPSAFKEALKHRIKKKANKRGMLYPRCRQLVLFDRFAKRLYDACGEDIILKGGFVVELRTQMARTTQDVDAHIFGNIEDHIAQIREVGQKQQRDDYLTFELDDPDEIQEHVGEQIVYQAKRIGVQAKIARKDFGEPFHLDVSTGDALVNSPDSLLGLEILEFADIPPVEHTVYPPETHVAEKLHAWTLPRDGKTNSRTKDLVDIGLLARTTDFRLAPLIQAVDQTFQLRDTHLVPDNIPDYPESWVHNFERMKEEAPLPWETLSEAYNLVDSFLQPVFVGSHETLKWKSSSTTWVEY